MKRQKVTKLVSYFILGGLLVYGIVNFIVPFVTTLVSSFYLILLFTITVVVEIVLSWTNYKGRIRLKMYEANPLLRWFDNQESKIKYLSFLLHFLFSIIGLPFFIGIFGFYLQLFGKAFDILISTEALLSSIYGAVIGVLLTLFSSDKQSVKNFETCLSNKCKVNKRCAKLIAENCKIDSAKHNRSVLMSFVENESEMPS